MENREIYEGNQTVETLFHLTLSLKEKRLTNEITAADYNIGLFHLRQLTRIFEPAIQRESEDTSLKFHDLRVELSRCGTISIFQ